MNKLNYAVAPKILTLALLVLSFSNASTYGQVPEQTVDVSAKKYDARREDTTAKQIVTREEIEKFGDTNLVDVLRRQAGITVVGNSVGLSGLPQYTQILIDGVPMSKASNLSEINPDQVERIEIIRSSLAEFSTQGIGGTINIVLKNKIAKTQRKLKFIDEHPNPSSYKRKLLAQLADKSSPVSYDIGTEFVDFVSNAQMKLDIDSRNAADQTVLAQQVIDHSVLSMQRVAFTPLFVWQATPNDVFTLQNTITATRLQATFLSNRNTVVGRPSFFPLESTKINKAREQLESKLTWNRSLDNGATLKVSAGLDFMLSKPYQVHTRGEEANGLTVYESFWEDNTKIVSWIISGNYSQPIGASHTLKIGWDTGLTSNNLTQYDRSATIENAQLSSQRLALFIQDEWKTTANWSNYLGLRWEAFQTKGEGSQFTKFTNKTGVLSPIVQSLLKFPNAKENQMRWALARTFRNPDSSEMLTSNHRDLNSSMSNPDTVGNPHLRPEIAYGLDTSFEHFGDNGVNLTGTLTLKHINDLIRNDIQFLNKRWVSSAINNGQAHSRTFNLTASLPLNVLLESAKHIDLRADCSSSLLSQSNIPNVLDHSFSANFGVDYHPSTEWSLGLAYNFSNSGEHHTSLKQKYYSKDGKRLDSYLLWKPNNATSVRFAATNLLAQDDIWVSRYVDTFGTTVESRLMPAFRQFTVTFELKI